MPDATLDDRVRRLTSVVSLIAVGCLLLIAFATLADVLSRWLFNAPIRGLVNLASIATAVIAAACFPAVIAVRGNVTIRLVGSALGARIARTLDLFGALATTVFLGLMTAEYVRYSAEMTDAGERILILDWPIGPWWWAVTGFIGLATLVGIVMLVADIRARRESRSERDRG